MGKNVSVWWNSRQKSTYREAWLAQSAKRPTLDLRVVISSPVLDVEPT